MKTHLVPMYGLTDRVNITCSHEELVSILAELVPYAYKAVMGDYLLSVDNIWKLSVNTALPKANVDDYSFVAVLQKRIINQISDNQFLINMYRFEPTLNVVYLHHSRGYLYSINVVEKNGTRYKN